MKKVIMRNNNYTLLGVILRMATLVYLLINYTGCKKYLDKKADSSQVVPTTIQDYQAILDDSYMMNIGWSPSFGESSADDYFLNASTYSTQDERSRSVYIWDPFDYKYQNDWSICYRSVYNANLCLEGIEKVSQTQQNVLQWNNIKGIALFFRAYSFLELTSLFGKAYDGNSSKNDLGVVLRLSSNFNTPSVRASVQDCYDRVIKDAKESVNYLPTTPQHVMRPSKAAAYGLLARAYLSMRQYDSASKYSTLCLEIKGDLLDYNNPSDVNISNFGSPFSRFNKETIFYVEMNYSLTVYGTWKAFIDSTVTASFLDNDLRKKAYFNSSGDYYRFKGSYSGDQYTLFTGIAVDEIYLTKAECLARTGHKDEALTVLNSLLDKRHLVGTFIPISSNTQEEAITIILSERRKELLMRGVRWSDIKRLNREGAGIILKRVIGKQEYVLPPNDKRYALPIPIDIIQNGNLEQN